MTETTATFDLRVKPSWFQGGVKHHIYLTAPLARALGAKDAGISFSLPAYVDGHYRSTGTLTPTTWFYSDVDEVFDALDIRPSDADRATIKAQGRRDPAGHWQLHFWREDLSGRATEAAPRSFSRAEVFPIVARLILAAAKTNPDKMVTHDRIVKLLQNDIEGQELVARALGSSEFTGKLSVASNMVAWFSQQISVGQSPWGDLYTREKIDGAWAYYPVPSAAPGTSPEPDFTVLEGEPRMFFHWRRERDPALVAAKRQEQRDVLGRLQCEVCGFTTDSAYPALVGDVCEIHHRKPIGETLGQTQTHLADLAVLCPNCHRAIHRTKPIMTVDEFKSHYLTTRRPV